MRYYAEFRLLDKTVLNAVVEGVKSEKEAKKAAVEISKICFDNKKDEKFVLTESTPCRIEKWQDTGKAEVRMGRFQCAVKAYYSRSDIREGKYSRLKGVKTAYNLILQSNQDRPKVVFIYDVHQKPERPKSARLKAQDLLKDDKKTKEVLDKFACKLGKMPMFGKYLEDVPILCSMILDYSKGKYREIPVSAIIAITGAIIYFVSPVNVIPDFIPVIGQIDDVGVIIWVLRQFHDDIQEYKRWRERSSGVTKGVEKYAKK